MTILTWADLVEAAAREPLLQACVSLADQVGREGALIATALALANQNRRLLEQEIDRLRHASTRPNTV